jgi:proton-coupled amino acid transporter
MASPSLPVNIGLPKPRPPYDSLAQPASPSGPAGAGTPAIETPDLRAIRANYAGTPPVPNIPPRGTGAGGVVTPLNRAASSVSIAVPTPLRQNAAGQAFGGLSATRQQAQQPAPSPAPTPLPDLDDLPVEEKVQILARHLVSNELRTKSVAGPTDEIGSDSRSSRSTSESITDQPRYGLEGGVLREGLIEERTQREESDPFPIHFHAPGADVT